MVIYSPSEHVPPARGVYLVCLIDVPGTVASQNFMSVLNPVNSGVLQEALLLEIDSYSGGASATNVSFAAYRITGQSGGTAVTPSGVNRFVTAMPDPLAAVLTGNPTVTRLNNNPLTYAVPPISAGVGDNTGTGRTSPPGVQALILPGEGVVFNTASGNINQFFCMRYVWAEYPIT